MVNNYKKRFEKHEPMKRVLIFNYILLVEYILEILIFCTLLLFRLFARNSMLISIIPKIYCQFFINRLLLACSRRCPYQQPTIDSAVEPDQSRDNRSSQAQPSLSYAVQQVHTCIPSPLRPPVSGCGLWIHQINGIV